MSKYSRKRHEPPEFLRAWRESLGLSRAAVCTKITAIRPEISPALDQATLAKWESGETAVRLQDVELLAEIYGITPDRFFYAPTDAAGPARLRRVADILQRASADDIEAWLSMGERLKK